MRGGGFAARLRRLAAPSLRLPSTPEARAPAIAAAIEAIRASDPAFDVQGLLRQLPARYLQVRRARGQDDSDALRAYLSPALLESGDFGAPADSSSADDLSDVTVEEVRLVWAEHSPRDDHLTAAIDSLTELVGELHTLTEYWTLVRPAGTATAQARGGECLQCGAPPTGESDLCRFCGSVLPGPLQGWMLERVDEEVDWYEGPAGSVV